MIYELCKNIKGLTFRQPFNVFYSLAMLLIKIH